MKTTRRPQYSHRKQLAKSCPNNRYKTSQQYSIEMFGRCWERTLTCASPALWLWSQVTKAWSISSSELLLHREHVGEVAGESLWILQCQVIAFVVKSYWVVKRWKITYLYTWHFTNLTQSPVLNLDQAEQNIDWLITSKPNLKSSRAVKTESSMSQSGAPWIIYTLHLGTPPSSLIANLQ